MKSIFSIVLAAAFGAALVSQAAAKTTPVAATRVSTWLGVWNCVSGKSKYTETFTPAFNGKAMHVSVTGPYASEGTAVFDAAHKAWFYAFVNADGSYAAMMGPVTGSNITFKQVYPPGDATEAIRGLSPKRYSSVFSVTSAGKKFSAAQVCDKV